MLRAPTLIFSARLSAKSTALVDVNALICCCISALRTRIFTLSAKSVACADVKALISWRIMALSARIFMFSSWSASMLSALRC